MTLNFEDEEKKLETWISQRVWQQNSANVSRGNIKKKALGNALGRAALTCVPSW
jgi:hypothetical protein